MRTMTLAGARVLALVVLVMAPAAAAHGQQRPEQRTQPPRRQQTIEIRGQVPTPQVVTVRPRETPMYSRRVLVPAFFDRDFWPSILPPLEIVSPARAPRPDSTRTPAADSARRVPPVPTRPPPGTPPAGRAAPEP